MNTLSSLSSLLAAFPVLADEVPAPEDVKAGWLGFAVFLALAAAVVLLGLSLRKHLRKVDFEEPSEPSDADERTTNGTT